MRYEGNTDFDLAGKKVSNMGNATNNDDAQNAGQAIRIIHQGGSRTARTIYVQLDGESDPSSPATGDIRILET